MYNINEVIELVGEDAITDPEKLMDFIIDNDMGVEFVRWHNCNSESDGE